MFLKRKKVRKLGKLISTVPIFLLIFFSNVQAVSLILNPGFESDFNNWTVIEPPATGRSIDTVIYRSGAKSCKFEDPTLAYTGRGIQSAKVSVNPGTSYHFELWYYVEEIAGTAEDSWVFAEIQWFNSSDVAIATEPAQGYCLSGFSEWKNDLSVCKTYNSPENAAQVSIRIRVKEKVANSNHIYIDDIDLHEISEHDPEIPTNLLPDSAGWFSEDKQVQATVSDLDGNQVKAYFSFDYWAGSDPSGWGTLVNSGQNSVSVFTLTESGEYGYQAYAEDSFGQQSGTTSFTATVNIDKSVPEIAPISCLTKPTGGSQISENTWQDDGNVYFCWTDPGTELSGRTFYWKYDTNSGDRIKSDAGNADGSIIEPYLNKLLSDGDYYFHVQAKTNAGKWGTEVTFRIKYDGAPPPDVTTLNSSTHDEDIWNSTNVVTVTWTDVNDLGSGTSGYYMICNHSPTTKPIVSDEFVNQGVHTKTYTGLTEAADWYFHIIAIDNTNLFSNNPDHFGPVKIDTTTPVIESGVFISPTGGEEWVGGSTKTITWNTGNITDNLSGFGAGPITLKYSTNTSFHGMIASGEVNDGIYSWKIPSFASSVTTKVQITVSDLAGNTTSQVSSSFRFFPPPLPPYGISVLKTNLDTGGELKITWTNPDDPDVVKVNFYRSQTEGVKGSSVCFVLKTSPPEYIDTGLVNGATYYYTLLSSFGVEESTNTDQYFARPLDSIPPLKVANFCGYSIGKDSQVLSWSANTDDDFRKYIIKRDTVVIKTLSDKNTTFYIDTTVLTLDTTYLYEIFAQDTSDNFSVSGSTVSILVYNISVEINSFVDDAVSDSFMPNGDGLKDEIEIKIEFHLKQTELARIFIVDGNGTVVFSSSTFVSGEETVSILWDGKDELGNFISDGNYYVKVSIHGLEFAVKMIEVKGAGQVAPVINNYPNPFIMSEHGSTKIRFKLEWESPVKIAIYNEVGMLVKTWKISHNKLEAEYKMSSGENCYEIPWDGKNGRGHKVSSGIYICLIKGGGVDAKTKIAIIR